MNEKKFEFLFLQKIRRTIAAHRLFKRGDRVLIGVSGGADSVCLLHVLCRLAPEYGLTLFAVHVNHCLRGKRSDADQAFTAALCERLGVPFYAERVDVAAYANETKLSIEAAAHEMRYAAFFSAARRLKANKIATAHNKNDNAETALAYFLRGSGTDGRSGIAPLSSDGLVRPLIDTTRAEIERYLAAVGEDYVIDHTNLLPDCTRNRLRIELIPYLKEHYNPNIIDTLSRGAALAAADAEYLDAAADRAAEELTEEADGLIVVFVEGLKGLHRAIASRVVRAAAAKVVSHSIRAVGYDTVERCLELAYAPHSGRRVDLGGGAYAVREYLRLVFVPPNKDKSVLDKKTPPYLYELTPGSDVVVREAGLVFQSELCEAGDKEKILVNQNRKDTASFDYNLIKGKIYIRNRKPGDVFFPAGMTGKKKLSDYFIDEKVPRAQRDRIPLICDEKRILWVAGYRKSAHARPDETSKKILTIRFRKEK